MHLWWGWGGELLLDSASMRSSDLSDSNNRIKNTNTNWIQSIFKPAYFGRLPLCWQYEYSSIQIGVFGILYSSICTNRSIAAHKYKLNSKHSQTCILRSTSSMLTEAKSAERSIPALFTKTSRPATYISLNTNTNTNTNTKNNDDSSTKTFKSAKCYHLSLIQMKDNLPVATQFQQLLERRPESLVSFVCHRVRANSWIKNALRKPTCSKARSKVNVTTWEAPAFLHLNNMKCQWQKVYFHLTHN